MISEKQTDNLESRRKKEKFFFTLFNICGMTVILILVFFIGYVVIMGISAMSWDFFTTTPGGGMRSGGIVTPLIGTIYLMGLVAIVSIPLGVLTAVYISEYQSNRLMGRVWKVVVGNLAGIPSIVYGLLGLAMFVTALGLGFSLLAASLTLSLLVLPIVIMASREAIAAVPQSIRDASTALGATKWQTTVHHVLPYSISGISTGIILALSRAAGETAPIMLTGAVFFMSLPPSSVTSKFMALPYHIYGTATQSYGVPSDLIFGAALALLLIVLGMNLVAIVIRSKFRSKYRW